MLFGAVAKHLDGSSYCLQITIGNDLGVGLIITVSTHYTYNVASSLRSSGYENQWE